MLRSRLAVSIAVEGFGDIVLLMEVNVVGSPDDGEDWIWGRRVIVSAFLTGSVAEAVAELAMTDRPTTTL